MCEIWLKGRTLTTLDSGKGEAKGENQQASLVIRKLGNKKEAEDSWAFTGLLVLERV